MRRPTKNVDKAVARLRRAAEEEGLIACSWFSYGGSIAGDLLAVLALLDAETGTPKHSEEYGAGLAEERRQRAETGTAPEQEKASD